MRTIRWEPPKPCFLRFAADVWLVIGFEGLTSVLDVGNRNMPQPPKLTDEQRRAALVKAGEARRVRAETKELLKTGSLRLSELFEQADTDGILAGIKVERLIAAMPGTGKIKAKRLMELLGIAENRRIRGLGHNQKAALIAEFS